MRDVSNIDTSTTIFSKRYNIPIAVAPSGYQKLAGFNGEIDVARAAWALGTNFTLSSSSTTALEDVAACLPERGAEHPRPWFQLYLMRSREFAEQLIKRVEAQGYEALVLTVDTVVLGNRIHERREPLKLPEGIGRANMAGGKAGGTSKGRLVLNAKTAKEAKAVEAEYHGSLVENTITFDSVVPWLRSQTNMKIILKGIMTAEDALLAVQAGVDGIVVSNHGARQLDGTPSTLEVLPEIADAVKGRIPVIFDGGIQSGSDVFKALALGADLCLVGRSALWGLAWDGQKGVEGVLHILERELDRTMALMGARSLKDIERGMLGRAKTSGFGVAKL